MKLTLTHTHTVFCQNGSVVVIDSSLMAHQKVGKRSIRVKAFRSSYHMLQEPEPDLVIGECWVSVDFQDIMYTRCLFCMCDFVCVCEVYCLLLNGGKEVRVIFLTTDSLRERLFYDPHCVCVCVCVCIHRFQACFPALWLLVQHSSQTPGNKYKKHTPPVMLGLLTHHNCSYSTHAYIQYKQEWRHSDPAFKILL